MEAPNSLSGDQTHREDACARSGAAFPVVLFGGDRDKLRSAEPSADARAKVKGSFLDRLSRADEIMLLHHLADAKRRKPN